MNIKSVVLLVLCFGVAALAAGCRKPEPEPSAAAPEFQWQIDQFADLKILRYQVPGFESLTASQKELVYYLSEAARSLIETYGVQVDQALHKEVLDRYAKLNLAPYSGFVTPVYTPVVETGKIVDVKVATDEGYVEQMLRYGKQYSFI